MRSYVVKEAFATLQGEGWWAGRRAVFLRLAGCNVWNGRPEDRHKGLAGCARWCDTDFHKGDRLSVGEILKVLDAEWGEHPAGRASHDCRMVVVTGGEPTLQLDDLLVTALHRDQWYVAVETNGTSDAGVLDQCDHVCVSPKAGMPQLRWRGSELKVVLPGGVAGAPPEHCWTHQQVAAIGERGQWGAKYVQPQDPTRETATGQTYLTAIRLGAKEHEVAHVGMVYDAHVRECLNFISQHAGWRLSLQGHKLIGIP